MLSYGFCSKFHTFSSSKEISKDRLRFDKVTERLKVITFLRHSVCSMVFDFKCRRVSCTPGVAGIHRTMENAKIRSLRMDSKVWTRPLIKVRRLFAVIVVTSHNLN